MFLPFEASSIVESRAGDPFRIQTLRSRYGSMKYPARSQRTAWKTLTDNWVDSSAWAADSQAGSQESLNYIASEGGKTPRDHEAVAYIRG